MKLKDLLLNEVTREVDEEFDLDIDVKIDFLDEDTDKEVYKFIGVGVIEGIHRTGTRTKQGDDEDEYTEDDYDNADFSLSKDTEKKVNDWLKKNNYKITDQYYYEFDLKKEKVSLGYTVKKK